MRKWLEEWGSEYVECDISDGRPSKALILKDARILKGNAGPTGDPTDPVVRRSQARAQKRLAKDNWPRLIFLRKGEGRPRLKRYLAEVKKGVVPMTYWADEDYDQPFVIGSTSWEHAQSGHSQAGFNELDSIVGKGHGFATVKPLKLIQKIVQLWCPPDGLIMDPFAGSGTVGHAVLNANNEIGANRRFILVERGRPDRGDSYARSLTADRLQRVVTGDWASGTEPSTGGGYRFATLQQKVDAEALLSMERDDLADTIIASHFDASTRRRDTLVRVPAGSGYKYLVAHNSGNEGFFLIWNGTKGNTDFTEATYEACAKEAKKAGLNPRYHIYARLYRYQTTNVVFYQIPDRILMDFGLDLRGEPYHDGES
jgi:adenine-specific DNA-methyltransferase